MIRTTLKALSTQLGNSPNTSIIHLGNLSGKHGLPDSSNRRRSRAEASLNHQLSLLSSRSGKVIINPGFKDWSSGKEDGLNNILNLEQYLNKFLDKENIVFPSEGCPGPLEIELTNEVLVVTINTQWYLHGWEKPYESAGCEVKEKEDLLIKLNEILERNRHRKVIVAGTHPLVSNGKYGGYNSLIDHLKFPVLGSLYLWNRKLIGEKPDLSNPEYRRLRKLLREILGEYPNVVYLAGHEQSLQYHKIGEWHHVISGAIGQRSAVAKNNKASFSHPGLGYGQLKFFENGKVTLEFFEYANNQFNLAYSELLYQKKHVVEPDLFLAHQDLDYTNQSYQVSGNPDLGRKRKRPWLYGSNYRKEWVEPIDVEAIDLGKEKGGLRIIKKGGGAQTHSLRLEDKEGKQWVLRSIEKYPEKALGQSLRGTIYSDILKDQVSASHPYGALALPVMADAIGIYHTNPRIVYLPEDPRLGVYQEQMGGKLYLFEERPDGDWPKQDSFGNSKNIISTRKLLSRLTSGNQHVVDQQLVLKSRLFDLLIGDWDRHEDQWRWASFKRHGLSYYQPIPRDRDQTFYNNDGAIVAIGSRKWISPQIRGFHNRIKYPEHLAGNGIHFDRTFLHQLTAEDWLEAAQLIQKHLSDSAIEQSLKNWPDEIYQHSGNEIRDKLIQRRNKLDLYALDYYDFLSRVVDIPGTDKRDKFIVEHSNRGITTVRGYRVNKSGKEKFQFYERAFTLNQTKEIRLFGKGHDDVFEIKGSSKKSIKVRVVGGDGDDQLNDHAQIDKGKSTIVYDVVGGIDINDSGNVKSKLRNNGVVNRYKRNNFVYDRLYPLVFIESNPDDGLFIGGGFGLEKQGFRQKPAVRHLLRTEIAPRSKSFLFSYSIYAADVIGDWNFNANINISEPSFSDFFYGFGNKTRFDNASRSDDSQFYRTRYSQWLLQPNLSLPVANHGQQNWDIGLRFRSVEIRNADNSSNNERFILNYSPAVISDEGFLDNRRHYLGPTIGYQIDRRNNTIKPTRGIRLRINSLFMWQLADEKLKYQQINSDFSFYVGSGGPLNPVLAFRIGGTVNFGEFQFYQSARIGGTSNLRGYRKFRFAGDESIYQNVELRLKIFNFRSRVLPGQVGITAFHDIGRVWTDQPDIDLIDNSLKSWHRGYGGGIWISPLEKVVFNIETAKAVDNDGLLMYLRLGFMF